MNDRHASLYNAPLYELLTILLRQLKKLLEPLDLNDTVMRDLAQKLPLSGRLDADTEKLRQRLIELIRESESVLAGWKLSFGESLRTEMGDLPGWESTSDFLEMANEKSNAELRIAAASVLVTALGDLQFVPYLLAAIDYDPQEIETVAARRILSQLSGVDFEAADWLEQVEAWLDQSTRPN